MMKFGRSVPAAIIGALTLSLTANGQAPHSGSTKAFIGATVIDGTGGKPLPDAVVVVRGQKIVALGPAKTTSVPPEATKIDVSGRTIVPGMINSHGHVGSTAGLESGAAQNTPENVQRQLALNARYGITTVVSLGDDREPGFTARAANDAPNLDRSRLYVAGPVITAKTPEEARAAVDAAAKLKPDWIKIRVDDNLGTTAKMSPEVYTAVIEQAHKHGLRVAVHLYYLDDAKGIVRAGGDLIAHSVRDVPVDRELLDLMKARNVCLVPTLMREVSTYVYETRPAFFDDPFFKREADPKVLTTLEEPSRQAGVASNRSAQTYKKQLEVARRNVKALHDAGIRLASGTDTGPPARFQGYFEHLELEELVKSGLTPAAALAAATGDAARCMGLADRVGTIQPGRYADLIVLAKSPLEDIKNTHTIESVWISGNRVPTAR
jgi:imidazolonepropionase-like amidohydrolase